LKPYHGNSVCTDPGLPEPRGKRAVEMDLVDILRHRVLVGDGAMGTQLHERGLSEGCPEIKNLDAPDEIASIHRSYIDAGADLIETNTFGGNRYKLAGYGVEEKAFELNRIAASIAKKSAGGDVLVAGSIGPTGQLLAPFGSMTVDDCKAAFKEQVLGLAEGGTDLLLVETMQDVREAWIAGLCIKEETDLPFILQVSFQPGGRTLMGTGPAASAVVLSALNPAGVGANCGMGPEGLLPLIDEMAASVDLPIAVFPNAGMPEVRNGQSYYPLKAEDMGASALKLRENGASIIGGCCGTGPEHIKEISRRIKGSEPVSIASKIGVVLAAGRKLVRFTPEENHKGVLLTPDSIDGTDRLINSQHEILCFELPDALPVEEARDLALRLTTLPDHVAGIHSLSEHAVRAFLAHYAGKSFVGLRASDLADTRSKAVLQAAAYYGAVVMVMIGKREAAEGLSGLCPHQTLKKNWLLAELDQTSASPQGVGFDTRWTGLPWPV